MLSLILAPLRPRLEFCANQNSAALCWNWTLSNPENPKNYSFYTLCLDFVKRKIIEDKETLWLREKPFRIFFLPGVIFWKKYLYKCNLRNITFLYYMKSKSFLTADKKNLEDQRDAVTLKLTLKCGNPKNHA